MIIDTCIIYTGVQSQKETNLSHVILVSHDTGFVLCMALYLTSISCWRHYGFTKGLAIVHLVFHNGACWLARRGDQVISPWMDPSHRGTSYFHLLIHVFNI